jgi:DNA-binding transcriptional LysR family regulator
VVGNSSLIEERVASRELDLGLIEIVTGMPNMDRTAACRDELLVICSPRHPLAGSSIASLPSSVQETVLLDVSVSNFSA